MHIYKLDKLNYKLHLKAFSFQFVPGEIKNYYINHYYINNESQELKLIFRNLLGQTDRELAPAFHNGKKFISIVIQ